MVISASHNPFADNGIKFFSARGRSCPTTWEREVEAALAASRRSGSTRPQLGKARRLDDASGRYIEFCKSTFANDLTLRGLKIVVDAAHGAAYHVAPDVFHELGAEVDLRSAARPTASTSTTASARPRPQALVDAVQRAAAPTSASRSTATPTGCSWSTRAGRLFNGDELLYVMVADRLAQRRARCPAWSAR